MFVISTFFQANLIFASGTKSHGPRLVVNPLKIFSEYIIHSFCKLDRLFEKKK